MEKRIIELEKKAAFQEPLIEELNQVIIDQQNKIEEMEKRLNIFEERLSREELVRPQHEEEPPPHY